jgi:hypothetical protein
VREQLECDFLPTVDGVNVVWIFDNLNDDRSFGQFKWIVLQ